MAKLSGPGRYLVTAVSQKLRCSSHRTVCEPECHGSANEIGSVTECSELSPGCHFRRQELLSPSLVLYWVHKRVELTQQTSHLEGP